MKLNYQAESNLEKFGENVYNLLVDNFPQTFFVGGMVRDLLLHREVTDIDIATQAKPQEVAKLLYEAGIKADLKHKQFGVVIAQSKQYSVEITSFRKEIYAGSRYPKITFISSAKIDSKRRDFTINSLYLSPKQGKVLDFYNAVRDLKLKHIKFIGNPEKRIKEDPLRIIRAFRFAKTLNFKLEPKTKKAIAENLFLLKTLTNSRIKNELAKIKNLKHKKYILRLVTK